jgi:hypothetical protein
VNIRTAVCVAIASSSMLATAESSFAAGGPSGGAGGGGGGAGGGGKVIAPALPFFVNLAPGSSSLGAAAVMALPNLKTSINAVIPASQGNFLFADPSNSFEINAASNILSTDPIFVPKVTLVSGPAGATLVSNFAVAAVSISGNWYPAVGGSFLTWVPMASDIGQTYPVTVMATTPGGSVQSTFTVTVVDQPTPVGSLAVTRYADHFNVSWTPAFAVATPLTYSVQGCGVVPSVPLRAGSNIGCHVFPTTLGTSTDIPLNSTTDSAIGGVAAGANFAIDQYITVYATSVKGDMDVLKTVPAPLQ